MEKLTCEQAKKIDLIDYLALLGRTPEKIRNSDYWYLSPLRDERTASFKVDRKLNLWYDHATGMGGDLIDFGTTYFKCTVSELLHKLSQQPHPSFSFHQPLPLSDPQNSPQTFAGEKKQNADSKIVIVDTRPLADQTLLAYLDERNILLAAAQSHCKEVDFLLYGRGQTVIGFRNNAGGYELRSADFKGSSSPKDITFISRDANELNVFEGFFNFLSFQSLHFKQRGQLTNFLVLNSLAFFEKSRPLMERHSQVNLYLDRDKAGMGAMTQAMKWNKDLYRDRSDLYTGFKDFNEWLVNRLPDTGQLQAKRLRLGGPF